MNTFNSKRKLKKSVKITGFAIAATFTGITLITTINHFSSSKKEICVENDSEQEKLISFTILDLDTAIQNYCFSNDVDYSYIWKNKENISYLIGNNDKMDETWDFIDDKDVFLQDLVDFNVNQISSYWIKNQKLMERVDAFSWRETNTTRRVPDNTPNFIFDGEDQYWLSTDRELIIDDQYNIFQFLQVYRSNDGKLFIGLNEPDFKDGSVWQYISGLPELIEKNQMLSIGLKKVKGTEEKL